MNNIVKGILIFVGGAIVGGGASFFATKSILTEMFFVCFKSILLSPVLF